MPELSAAEAIVLAEIACSRSLIALDCWEEKRSYSRLVSIFDGLSIEVYNVGRSHCGLRNRRDFDKKASLTKLSRAI